MKGRNSMRVCLLAGLVLCVFCLPALAEESGFAGRPITTNAFGETGYTLNANEFTIGFGPIYYGITDRVHAGTNLLLWAFQVYNGDVKFALVDTDQQALSLGVSASRLSLDHLFSGEEFDFWSFAPYGAYSHRLGKNTFGHIGARVAFWQSEDDEDINDAEPDASSTGTFFYTGVEHSVSNRTKWIADIGYDTTFEGARFSGGVLFGWTKFRLKLGLSYFTAGDGFTFPLVGMWWRFGA
jgi:hypothetical protein